MKFPYKLSKDRLSLLSKEDLALYEYEHSPFFSHQAKVRSVKLYQQSKSMRQGYYMNMINEDEEFKNLEPTEKEIMSRLLTEIEALDILDLTLKMLELPLELIMDKEDVEKVKDDTIKLLMAPDDDAATKALNDAALMEDGGGPGHDMTYWLGDLGFIGKIAGGLLSIAGTGMAGLIGLIMAGHDKAAAKQLEKYMNKMVEITDTGLHKKKSIFSFFGKGKNKGDQSQACFRAIQEFVERDMAKNSMIMGKACGLLSGNGLEDANRNDYTAAGLLGDIPGSFKTNVIDKIDVLVKKV